MQILIQAHTHTYTCIHRCQIFKWFSEVWLHGGRNGGSCTEWSNHWGVAFERVDLSFCNSYVQCLSYVILSGVEFQGLRPVLKVFVVTVHGGAGETGGPIPRAYCSHKSECIVTTDPDRSVLIPITTWPFSFQPVNVSTFNSRGEYGTRNVSRATPIVTSRDGS